MRPAQKVCKQNTDLEARREFHLQNTCVQNITWRVITRLLMTRARPLKLLFARCQLALFRDSGAKTLATLSVRFGLPRPTSSKLFIALV